MWAECVVRRNLGRALAPQRRRQGVVVCSTNVQRRPGTLGRAWSGCVGLVDARPSAGQGETAGRAARPSLLPGLAEASHDFGRCMYACHGAIPHKGTRALALDCASRASIEGVPHPPSRSSGPIRFDRGGSDWIELIDPSSSSSNLNNTIIIPSQRTPTHRRTPQERRRRASDHHRAAGAAAPPARPEEWAGGRLFCGAVFGGRRRVGDKRGVAGEHTAAEAVRQQG